MQNMWEPRIQNQQLKNQSRLNRENISAYEYKQVPRIKKGEKQDPDQLFGFY